jgi:hypothetical protein
MMGDQSEGKAKLQLRGKGNAMFDITICEHVLNGPPVNSTNLLKNVSKYFLNINPDGLSPNNKLELSLAGFSPAHISLLESKAYLSIRGWHMPGVHADPLLTAFSYFAANQEVAADIIFVTKGSFWGNHAVVVVENLDGEPQIFPCNPADLRAMLDSRKAANAIEEVVQVGLNN